MRAVANNSRLQNHAGSSTATRFTRSRAPSRREPWSSRTSAAKINMIRPQVHIRRPPFIVWRRVAPASLKKRKTVSKRDELFTYQHNFRSILVFCRRVRRQKCDLNGGFCFTSCFVRKTEYLSNAVDYGDFLWYNVIVEIFEFEVIYEIL